MEGASGGFGVSGAVAGSVGFSLMDVAWVS